MKVELNCFKEFYSKALKVNSDFRGISIEEDQHDQGKRVIVIALFNKPSLITSIRARYIDTIRTAYKVKEQIEEAVINKLLEQLPCMDRKVRMMNL